MAILITGGAGFIGSHVTDELICNGYEVIIADNLSTGNKNNINNKAKFYHTDLNDFDNLEKVFKENNIDYVIHLAAQANVGVSMENPSFDAQENILASINLLTLSKKYSAKKFIAASTAAVYGNPDYLPVDEKHPLNYMSYYALSKFTMENYIKLFGIDYLILRFSNVYGSRQDSKGEAGVVSIFIESALSGKNIKIHGDGEQTRDFIYVKDIAKAVLKAVVNFDIKNETVNISSNTSISVMDLFNSIKKLAGLNIEYENTQARTGDIKDSILDNSKALTLLKDWSPKIKLNEGLSETINWKKDSNYTGQIVV